MKKLLFIRYKKAKNILEGGEQGSQKNYNVLSKLLGEENVTVYYIHDESKKKNIPDYIKAFFFLPANYFYGLTPKRVRKIVQIAQEYDYVFIDRSVFGILAKRLKETEYKGKIITFFHNVEVSYFSAKLPSFLPWRPFVLHNVNNNDRYSCQYSDKIIALNDRDEKELIKRYDRKADILIPVAFKDKYKNTNYSNELTSIKPVCLFLGAYFLPNNEGIKWFIEQVYPFVDIQLEIVGKGMDKFKRENNIDPAIKIYSNVPELESFFERADIMVLPIFKGGGMKVKTCEALMYGKNILGTTETFEGYDVDFDKVGGLCNTKEEYIRKINEFIKNPRPRYNAYSRQQFLEKYSEDAVVDKFEQIFF
jgi:hypothetical protein